MSSPVQETEIEAKTGHAPAVKVGGMRVAQRSRKDSEESKSKEKTEKSNENQTTAAFGLYKPPVMVPGPPVKIEQQVKDFPKEETKHAHDKPLPTHQPGHNTKPAVIQQPRK